MLALPWGIAIWRVGAVAGRSPEPSGSAALAPASSEALVGTWGYSIVSYADASTTSEGARFGATGVFERGTLRGDTFTAMPGVGPSGPDFEMRYEVGPPKTIIFYLDGAEEQAELVVTGPDRWETHSGPPDDVTVYYARRP